MKAMLMKEWANIQQINRLIVSTIEYYAAVFSLDFRPTLEHKFLSFVVLAYPSRHTHTFFLKKYRTHLIDINSFGILSFCAG